jgi:cytochrome c-type biogenesis protein CcmH
MCSILRKEYPSPASSRHPLPQGEREEPRAFVVSALSPCGRGYPIGGERGRLTSIFCIVFLFFSILSTPIFAVEPSEIMSDPVKEQRARSLSLELRCLVCQNQSIDDSNAGLAKDLRVVVRERILAGDSDEAVKSYLVARYGEFVLLKPTFSTHNFLLWTLPFLGLGLGMFLVLRRRKPKVENGLSEEEQRQLKDVLETPLQKPPKN